MNTDLELPLSLKKPVRSPGDRRIATDELIANLRDTICSGQLHAGSRVTVSELRRRFGVSRTPLRKALRILAFEGLVIMLPGKSAIVAPRGRRRNELIPILCSLEMLAGELAWANIDDGGVTQLRLLHQRCVDSFMVKDVSSYMDADAAMREVIFKFASNRKLVDLYRIIHAQLRLPLLSGTSLPEWSNAIQEQDRILRALEMKNAYMCSLFSRRYMRHRAANLDALVSTDVSGQRIRRAGRGAPGRRDHALPNAPATDFEDHN
jgi:DNA-binding GntR family transcriptional regulator